MDDAPQNAVSRCPQCNAPADDALIFCRNCGTALRTPLPLTHSLADDPGSPLKPKSLPRKIFALALKALAGIAAGVAVLCPLSTFTEIVVFFASIAVAIICYGVLTNMDETHVDEYGNNGYWPKPLNWNASPHAQGLSKEDSAAE
jgi:hypothetical protein